jgi:hypothetical protein
MILFPICSLEDACKPITQEKKKYCHWIHCHLYRCWSYGLQHRVHFQADTDVSEEYIRGRQYVPPKRWYLPTSTHGVAVQTNNIDVFTAMRTSNLTV